MTTRNVLVPALVAATLAFAAGPAAAAELKILVTTEVEAAVEPLAAAFGREKGHHLIVGTAGRRDMRTAGDRPGTADVVIVSSEQVDQMIKRGAALTVGRRDIGRVGLGVFVRDGARVPAIGTTDALGKSLVAASGVVYGAAGTGRGFGKVVQSLELTADLHAKTTRLTDRYEVIDFVLRGKGDEVGIAPITDIRANAGNALRYVGPLPADVQDYTSFSAAVLKNSAAPALAQAFIEYLGSPAAKTKLALAGIE